jgi:hypothetical protein
MADAEQLWIIIHSNVIYAIFGVITKENFNQSYSAPRCAGATVRHYCWLIADCFSAAPGGGGGGGGGGGSAEISLMSQTNKVQLNYLELSSPTGRDFQPALPLLLLWYAFACRPVSSDREGRNQQRRIYLYNAIVS